MPLFYNFLGYTPNLSSLYAFGPVPIRKAICSAMFIFSMPFVFTYLGDMLLQCQVLLFDSFSSLLIHSLSFFQL